jgi:hypothetical protein
MRVTKVVACWDFMQVVLFSPGSFQSTAGQAWQDLHQLGPGIFRTQQDHGIDEPLQKRAKDISRKGFAGGRTQEFAGGPQIEKFKGGKYSRFVLTGLIQTFPRRLAAFLRLSPRKKSG